MTSPSAQLCSSSRFLTHTCLLFFFFNYTPPTEIYTLSLHDALPIFYEEAGVPPGVLNFLNGKGSVIGAHMVDPRSEEHTSELQSLTNLVCRLLLEKKNNAMVTLIQKENRQRRTTDELKG